MLSMVDPAVLPHVDPERGCAKAALPPLVAWFNGAMRQLRPEEVPDVDLVCLISSWGGGLQGLCVCSLQAASMQDRQKALRLFQDGRAPADVLQSVVARLCTFCIELMGTYMCCIPI